ncbi:hypothetical protein F750_2013 [Streptomyces sp. PAMC 26508]|nr:hypothetical protein F750_2013 [Streptomyces sp. PAMC 26508]
MVHEPTLRRFIRSSAFNDCKRGPGPLITERTGPPYGCDTSGADASYWVRFSPR